MALVIQPKYTHCIDHRHGELFHRLVLLNMSCFLCATMTDNCLRLEDRQIASSEDQFMQKLLYLRNLREFTIALTSTEWIMSKMSLHDAYSVETQILAIQFWKGVQPQTGPAHQASTQNQSFVLPSLGRCRYVTRPWTTTRDDKLQYHAHSGNWESNKVIIPNGDLAQFWTFILRDMFVNMPQGAFIKIENWNCE